MLFTAPLFKILSREDRRAGLKIRGYVDNGLLTSAATTENEAVVRLQKVFAIANKWVLKKGSSGCAVYGQSLTLAKTKGKEREA